VRHGTLSIIAALDLHSGEIIANVEPRQRRLYSSSRPCRVAGPGSM